ncbi:MAG: hypothetical protein ACK6CT_08080 [Planctomycetia bacterium]|jgi:hypothetical protein
MNPPHRIHLGNAWEPVPAVAVPGRRAGWRRRFGRPAGLEPGTSVWLVIEHPAACAVVFNGRELPPAAAGCDYRHEVGGRIGLRNDLLLEPVVALDRAVRDAVPTAVGSGRVPLPAACGRVWLEIDETAGDNGADRS